MKKILSLLIAMVLTFSSIEAKASVLNTLGTLSYWYSDDVTIGRWNSNFIKVYKNKLNTNNSFAFLDGVTYACDSWGYVLGKSISSGINNFYIDNPSIVYYGGTRAEIIAQGQFYPYQSDNGLTQPYDYYEGDWTYGSTYKAGVLIYHAEGCIVDNGRTTAEYKNTCTHELGHSLGWYGHSLNSLDIMYPVGSNIITLTSNEKNHLSQVY
jgi:hypothetical protein